MGFKDEKGLQAKSIRSILGQYCDKWLQTLPESLRGAAERDTIVTGGCIASMLLGEEVHDVDLYLRTYETALALAKHYVAEWKQDDVIVQEILDLRGVKQVKIKVKSEGVDTHLAKSGSFKPVFVSSNAITLAGYPHPLQIVLRFWGEPETIHGTYDFVHCTNYWEMASDKLTLRSEALEALLSRTLVYRGSLYPVCTIMRLRKFIARGWRINAGQVLKILLQVGELNLKDRKVLEDQLTGVDSAYFEQALRLAGKKDGDAIDHCHLIQCVEQCFNDGVDEVDEALEGSEGGEDPSPPRRASRARRRWGS